jgi:LemA protein
MWHEALLGIAVIVVVSVLWFVATYNCLVRLRNLVQEAWSGIDVQLKRRHSLIPRLVDVVRGYSEHERGVLEEVARARAESAAAGGVKDAETAENVLTGHLKRLFAVVEANPDLRANVNFLDLQKQLAEVEEQIQFARRYYNGAARDLNIRIESFPSMLVARLFGFQRAEFFQIETATERQPPEVKTQ